jgi:hypothetical protein
VLVRFPAYRTFEASRIATNDAAMALLVSTRIAALTLDKVPASKASQHLPALFPSVEHMKRLDRTAADAKDLILDAERHFTYMAIPFVLTVYSTFIVDAIRLLRDAGLDARADDPTRLKLSELHDYLDGAGVMVPQQEREIFAFIRLIRNRIVHSRGIEGSTLRSSFIGMPKSCKELWRYLSGGDPPLGTPKEELALEARHLIPALSVTKHLGEAINVALSSLIPARVWADVATRDFLSEGRPASRVQLLRKLTGFARHHYGALDLDEASLDGALRRYLAEKKEKGGSSC